MNRNHYVLQPTATVLISTFRLFSIDQVQQIKLSVRLQYCTPKPSSTRVWNRNRLKVFETFYNRTVHSISSTIVNQSIVLIRDNSIVCSNVDCHWCCHWFLLLLYKSSFSLVLHRMHYLTLVPAAPTSPFLLHKHCVSLIRGHETKWLIEFGVWWRLRWGEVTFTEELHTWN